MEKKETNFLLQRFGLIRDNIHFAKKKNSSGLKQLFNYFLVLKDWKVFLIFKINISFI